jgi:hypothetical protein
VQKVSPKTEKLLKMDKGFGLGGIGAEQTGRGGDLRTSFGENEKLFPKKNVGSQ